jgi:hypothetical protein
MSDTFRPTYRELNEQEKKLVADIKSKAVELMDLFESAVAKEERSDKSRCVNLARTKLEESIMWAVKGITG